ncbi:MAG TPA: response regulator [Candidatus Wallbacteria bacterium]|nr:MAG: Chemotaxis protein CheY [bacterium ADurb.Bin243]HPG58137.1 response regulator [Candidatus Wallbacteria bacterium]
MKVLIVEDEDATRFVMAGAVKSRGHEVKSARDGLQGLQLFKEFQPDIVISDINMPEMDGLEMLENIRQIDPNSIFIINSTLDSPRYTLKALRLKANDYLIKPVLEKDIICLLDKYSEIIANRTKDREVFGMINRCELDIEISNQLHAIKKIIDRLMLETEHAIPALDRLGIHLGLLEMLTNAIEHGNLEITYEEKTRALEQGVEGWHNIFQTRAGAAPYMDRKVTIEFKMDKKQCEWIITDQGKGFDWTKVPDPNDPQNLLAASHGRGIILSKLQFDDVQYLGCGNKVRLIKLLA